MDAIKGTIFSILTGMKQFVVPVYQRITVGNRNSVLGYSYKNIYVLNK